MKDEEKKHQTYQAKNRNSKRPEQTGTEQWEGHYQNSESLRNPTPLSGLAQYCPQLSQSLHK